LNTTAPSALEKQTRAFPLSFKTRAMKASRYAVAALSRIKTKSANARRALRFGVAILLLSYDNTGLWQTIGLTGFQTTSK
jgi:hypothetical protein